MRIGDLTSGERLVVYRRRRNLTQRQLAEEMGLSLYAYRQMENDERRNRRKCGRLQRLEPYEECFVRRRRSGKTAAEVAREIGVSRYWLQQMEMGLVPSDRLQSYWEE